MSVLSEILNEEYERLTNVIISFEKARSELPKGTIRNKKIHGRVYSYLQWRDGDKILSRYVKDNEREALERQIKARKQKEEELRTLKAQKKEFNKLMGKEL
jgi:cytoplasmic iron level regulating protein YaaA (DUF328/UPF0246 family)